jgi:hypothetical protein
MNVLFIFDCKGLAGPSCVSDGIFDDSACYHLQDLETIEHSVHGVPNWHLPMIEAERMVSMRQ